MSVTPSEQGAPPQTEPSADDSFPVQDVHPTLSGPMPETDEYRAIRKGNMIAFTQTPAGEVSFVSYRSPRAGNTTRYAVVCTGSPWRIVSYALIDGAQADYSTSVQALSQASRLLDEQDNAQTPPT